jgi:hypothetical protein
MALTCITCWLYSIMPPVARTFEFIDPVIPQNNWTRKENKGWILSRRINQGTSSMNAAELTDHVRRIMAKSSPPVKQYISDNV